jgi:hypothetical protein
LEQGKRSPSWDTVLALAKALRVSVGVFSGEDAFNRITREVRRVNAPKRRYILRQRVAFDKGLANDSP